MIARVGGQVNLMNVVNVSDTGAIKDFRLASWGGNTSINPLFVTGTLEQIYLVFRQICFKAALYCDRLKGKLD